MPQFFEPPSVLVEGTFGATTRKIVEHRNLHQDVADSRALVRFSKHMRLQRLMTPRLGENSINLDRRIENIIDVSRIKSDGPTLSKGLDTQARLAHATKRTRQLPADNEESNFCCDTLPAGHRDRFTYLTVSHRPRHSDHRLANRPRDVSSLRNGGEQLMTLIILQHFDERIQ